MIPLNSRKLSALIIGSIFVTLLVLAKAESSICLAYLAVVGGLVAGQSTIDTVIARNGGSNGKPA